MLNARVVAELASSGLAGPDIHARDISNPERAATGLGPGTLGYVIPYFSLDGKPVPFYRVKAFDHSPKYKQVKATPNHIYFPLGVKDLIFSKGYVIITEGEKKAASAVKNGFPCVALGGVDSWRNRTLVLPENTKIKNVPGQAAVSIKIDDGDIDIDESNLATGLQMLIDICIERGIFVLICFDNDEVKGDAGNTKFEVQRSAATLGFELRFRGISLGKIKQLFLPPIGTNGSAHKVGLDDFLQSTDATKKLQASIEDVMSRRNAFPRHPNIEEFVGRRLQRSRASRKEQQQTAIAILADIDARGYRMFNSDKEEMFFFENKSRTLMPASLRTASNDIIQNSRFARWLFKTYGISSNDKNVMAWLATYFTTEDPIGTVSPKRVCCVVGDKVYQQLNDGQYLVVSPSARIPFELKNNGDDGILFEISPTNHPLDGDMVLRQCYDQLNSPSQQPFWPEVLKEVRLRERDKNETVIALLFYLSPWLQRWRGTQLPIEMMIGEPGSGKSSLYELRLNILLGEPALRNAPRDLRDWNASIANTGGIHVTDNLHMVDKSLRQSLSDELCRLCTEPNPRVEMRKLYSNNEQIKIPVSPTFGITAVSQPFNNSDIMQRSVIIDFDKGDRETSYDGLWSTHKLAKFGGRAAWLAHQMVMIHRFLAHVNKPGVWNAAYKAKHRLINFEQALIKMAEVLNIKGDWIPEHLAAVTEANVSTADWAFEGLCEFATEWCVNHGPEARISASDIAAWAEQHPDYRTCNQLTNSRMLGKYMSSHRQMLSTIAGVKFAGKYANRDSYIVDRSEMRKIMGSK